MKTNQQQHSWQDLQSIWDNSSFYQKIEIEIPELIAELKAKTSQFEKESIHSDLKRVSKEWHTIKTKLSPLEKDLLHNDFGRVKKWIQNIKGWFKSK